MRNAILVVALVFVAVFAFLTIYAVQTAPRHSSPSQ